MTIGTGNQIDAADLNTVYDQLRVGLNDRDGAIGTNNKYRKTCDWMHVFNNLTATTHGDVNGSHYFTPKTDVRLLAMGMTVYDAADSDLVTFSIHAVETPETLTPPISFTDIDDSKFFLMRNIDYSISVNAPASATPAKVFSDFLTRDATNGDASELVLFGGVKYELSCTTAANPITLVTCTICVEHTALRFAK